ncbi:hypothetical protein BDY24DRAFT_199200 [Mrakia frigida]|uniref:uncharacterized protein n=1 Tax=Mrakia frigida TaxID=29902 RepID=UPI003FCBF04D
MPTQGQKRKKTEEGKGRLASGDPLVVLSFHSFAFLLSPPISFRSVLPTRIFRVVSCIQKKPPPPRHSPSTRRSFLLRLYKTPQLSSFLSLPSLVPPSFSLPLSSLPPPPFKRNALLFVARDLYLDLSLTHLSRTSYTCEFSSTFPCSRIEEVLPLFASLLFLLSFPPPLRLLRLERSEKHVTTLN